MATSNCINANSAGLVRFDGIGTFDAIVYSNTIQTFTPTITGGTTNPTPTYTLQSGNYTKIGRMVFFSIVVQVSALVGGTGNLLISGLPFTSANITNQYQAGTVSTTLMLRATYQVNPNTTIMQVFFNDLSANSAQLPATTITSINVTGAYMAST